MTTQPNDPRTPRELETREAESRDAAWIVPSALPDPSQRPGLTHRWVRTSSMGQSDPVNVSQSFREGWTPILASEYPELNIQSDHGTRWPEGVEVGGLLLCSASAAHMRKRREHYRKITQSQMKSVNDQLEAEEDPRLRTMFRQHQTSVSRGFGPNVRRERNGPEPKPET
jgi:hypothetical protein